MATDQPSIRILRPGTFIDVHGTRVTFTRADLAEVAAGYDAEADPAPLVIGHPKTDDPAYGWVGSVRMEGDELVATPTDLHPAFAEAVRTKAYRKVSSSLYPPTHPSNPRPGSWHLKHVGFLGAAAPGVKGLGTVSFAHADDDTTVTLVPDQEPIMADTPDTTTDTIALSEHEAQTSTLQARIDELETAAAERTRLDAEAAQAARHGANVAFAEGLIAAATLAPHAKDKVVGLMDLLDAETVVSFGEGDDAAATPLAVFRSLFEGAQPVIALGEAAGADKPAAEPASAVELAEQAVQFVAAEAAAGRAVTVQAAVRHVERAAAAA